MMRLGMTCWALFAGLWASSTAAQPPDHVLFIAVDDLRDWTTEFGGVRPITPNLDRLVAGGVHFRRAHCQIPLCNPSRASVLTGLRPDRTVSTTQENIILVEAVIYPTAIGLAERSWLAVGAVATRKAGDSPTARRGERNPRSELTDWVAKTLHSQTHASRPEPSVPQRLANPAGDTMPASAETPIRR